ncbi:DUF7619 domain-containing protein [Tenacibaculum ovolyticum]|uniref:DUF7619 domain-containing protein n=1 Tax=Tenacibaculum ovolyticum TaxID=104270 RepID=UPI003BAA782A
MKKLLLVTLLIGYFTIGNAQNINFPDSNFKNGLLNHIPVIDTSNDGEISEEEAANYTQNISLLNKGIINAKGIEYFINLRSLNLSKNELTEIDLSSNIELMNLYLTDNNLISIDLSSNTNLFIAYLDTNNLTNVNVNNLTRLRLLSLSRNNLTNIDVSTNVGLTSLQLIYDNNLTNLDISSNTNLESFSLSGDNFTGIDLSNNINLKNVHLRCNNLTNLDVSKQINLESLFLVSPNLLDIDLSSNINLNRLNIQRTKINKLDVRSCSLTSINFSQNSNLETVFMTGQAIENNRNGVLDVLLYGTPKLEFICADQIYLNDISSLLGNRINVMLSSDCGNLIEGTITYDANSDGCDSTDLPFIGGVKVSAISLTGAPPIFVFPNEQGKYNLRLDDDTYFIGPALQNLNYYTFSTPIIPAPINIPAQLNTLITDYCVKPIGNFNDLEISFIPVNGAIPGFNATYILTYKNIGTTTQSGNITVDYQKDVLNYVSSTPTTNSNTDGQLTWSFTNLLPMQSIEIPVIFTLNTPTDSPALNNGDILNYTATVTGATDETPDNNVMSLLQTVVNSYDPNDKTCLEGNILKPDNVGSYLHYLIRFENKGTAEAVNIRVKDVIDTTKLDIESLIPLKSSHSYSTTITNGNEVEFIFNNINLPFDDANNDGYVLFKIKSKATLVEGDKIVNGAAIYFDFNAPVITEDEIVTVKKEVIEQPKFSDYFTLSPNPTTGILNLTVLDESIQISYITIYDIGGNLVGYYLGTTRTMDVSYLYPNNYFMKIITNKGEQVTQFIKL